MQKHPVLISINGKICSKCNIDKPKDSFHNDKYKKDGKKTIPTIYLYWFKSYDRLQVAN